MVAERDAETARQVIDDERRRDGAPSKSSGNERGKGTEMNHCETGPCGPVKPAFEFMLDHALHSILSRNQLGLALVTTLFPRSPAKKVTTIRPTDAGGMIEVHGGSVAESERVLTPASLEFV